MIERYPFIENPGTVLDRLGGNEAFLERLMGKFLVSYRDARAALSLSLAEGKFEDAYRLVHSIKGVSSNLGMGSLYRLSVNLENLLKEKTAGPGTPQLAMFLAELDSVLFLLERAESD